MIRWLAALTLLFALALPAAAQPGAGPHVRMALVAETATPAPGSTVALAIDAVPGKGWHAYWENPGDAGLPARAAWTLPEGMNAGPLRYPVPQRLTIAGLMNYVFEGPYALLTSVTVPAGAAPGTKLPIALTLDYLVCTDSICVPERARLSTELRVGAGGAERRADFDRWRSALPRPLGSPAQFQAEGGRVRIGIPYPASAPLADAYFYPRTQGAIDYAAPQTVARDGDRIIVEAAAKGSTPAAIEGMLAIGRQGFDLRATPGSVPAAAPGQAPWLATLLAFLGAVLGGVILNIMPCVFPILSLKALSLAKANSDAGHPRAEALAYTAGVVLVCLALGAILLAVRAGGASVGWAFQLQDPRVILVLLLLVTGIALNLAGLFELSAPGFVNRAAAKGSGGAFATGALAAFVATPCSGPFMAGALGAALVLPWPAALAVFGGLGLGIALPFLLLGFIPALRRRLPRPGAWMATLRRILSVPMFLTAVALAWVLWRQVGERGLAIGGLALGLLALGLIAVRLRQRKGAPHGWALAAPALLLACGAAALLPAAGAAHAPTLGEPFSEARLAALRAEGRPVFAYFTADWCLTCKVNEKGVIETEAVAKALAAGKVAVLVGDWTNGDPALGRFIEAHNRAGVPLYLWYQPGEAAPRVLPQILTQQAMIDLARGG